MAGPAWARLAALLPGRTIHRRASERLSPRTNEAFAGTRNGRTRQPEGDTGALHVHPPKDSHVRGAPVARLTRLLRSFQDHTGAEDRRLFGPSLQRLHPVFQRARGCETRRGGLDAARPGVLRTHDGRRRYRRLRADTGHRGTLQERGVRRHRIQERVREERIQHRPVRSGGLEADQLHALRGKVRLKFRFEQPDNPYWVEKDGSTKTVYVADVRPITARQKSPSHERSCRALLHHHDDAARRPALSPPLRKVPPRRACIRFRTALLLRASPRPIHPRPVPAGSGAPLRRNTAPHPRR